MSGQNREPEDDDRDLEIFDWDEYGRRSSWQFVSNALLLAAVILFAPGVLLGFTKAWHVAAAWTAIPLLALSIFIHWRSRLTLDAVTRPGNFSARVDDLIATLDQAKAVLDDLKLTATVQSKNVKRLQTEVSAQQQLGLLTEPAAAAVEQMWAKLLKAERRPNFRSNAIAGLLSFIAGALWSTFVT